ncbi:Homeobox-leucine zipper protein family [Quillaja saponaria]|uniref:Homeobox-leucine zipper protein family n=1 Tax=Quillaja saponaria TaxID=32244 RepID=A0AAD7QD94_QUISA|nr:Homeobox-leucine zipper protein family [Quillaja saponaria]
MRCIDKSSAHFKEKKQIIKENKRAPPILCLDLPFELCPPKKEALKVDHHDHKAADDGKSDSNNGNCRKKLRLTKEQSDLLENSFKLHTTLNPTQKQALTEQLNVNPRQVEVWFQNKRARTKLKQTEVDCEFLKKCCESLSNENRRLKKELQELRTIFKVGVPLTMCSLCNNEAAATGENMRLG